MIKKPMLAVSCDDVAEFIRINAPLIATEKIDGIRALKINGKLVSRNLKPIPNDFIREQLEAVLPDGADGELISTGTFNETSSLVMSKNGRPSNITYVWFDYVKNTNEKPYNQRFVELYDEYENLSKCEVNIKTLKQVVIQSVRDFTEFETTVISNGGEGVILRSLCGIYKFGRSTLKEAYLVKVKRFVDREAYIVDFVEKMHNNNEVEKDLLDRTKRSKKLENLVAANTLGAIMVADVETGWKFEIGTGFNDVLRKQIWDNKVDYVGKLIKYKYFPTGMLNKPRFPVFVGFRHENDL